MIANIGGYVSGAFLVALSAGLCSLLFLSFTEVSQYAVALAFVVAVLDVIPMIGATLGAVVVSAIAFATDVKTGVVCVIFFVIYQQVENYVIYPKVMSRSVDIPGSLIVIAALVGAALLGVVGALLAIPTAAAVAKSSLSWTPGAAGRRSRPRAPAYPRKTQALRAGASRETGRRIWDLPA